jgi:hypothetical protein
MAAAYGAGTAAGFVGKKGRFKMNEALIRNYFHQRAAQAVPEDVDLWPRILSHLDQGAPEAIPARSKPRRQVLRGLALVVLALAALAAGSLAFPWGRAFAQSLFQFFNLAPSDTIQMPAEYYGKNTAPTFPPTFEAQLAAVPLSTVTPQPTASEVGPASKDACQDHENFSSYPCQVQRAEAKAGFDAKEPPSNLQGYVFTRAIGNGFADTFSIHYEYAGGGSYLNIYENNHGFGEWSSNPVPAGADLQPVTVHGLPGEYVQGYFVNYPGSTTTTWDSNAGIHRLRWQEDGIAFQIEVVGGRPGFETKEDLVALAESLVYSPNIDVNLLRPDYLPSVADAELISGLDLLEPTILPEGFSFDYAAYDTNSRTVTLHYWNGDPQMETIHISQSPLSADGLPDLAVHYPDGMVESIQINGLPGQFVRGIFYEGVWQINRPRNIVWAAQGMQIFLSFDGNIDYGMQLDKGDLIAIAESMK